MNDFEAQLLREIKKFRYTVIGIVLLIIVGLVVAYFNSLREYSSFANNYWPIQGSKSSLCGDESFRKKVDELDEAGKYKEVISFSDERIKVCPSDAHAWFFKARALAIEGQWDEALEPLGKAELLRPDWRYSYIKPLRESIEWNKEQSSRPKEEQSLRKPAIEPPCR
jgi:tetratricopeptide (TPR) repeat protein